MSAAARAEARRKAILSRGTDRLAKLTTSGRGDEALYAQDAAADPPLPSFPSAPLPTNLSNFVGEETAGMPRARTRVASNANASANANANVNPFGMPDPSTWSAEQQSQFMQVLMGGGAPPGGADDGMGPGDGNPFAGMGDNNPFAAMMAAGAGGAGGPGMGNGGGPFPGMENGNPFAAMMGAGAGAGAGKAPDVSVPRTRVQRLMPAVHLAAVWALLAYFVVVREPAAAAGGAGEGAAWRWRQLAGAAGAVAWGVQAVPFFWAFVTLELALHSLRIFSGFDAFRPPMLLGLVMPHLPPPIPAVIVYGMKYLQMGSLFLDDIAAVIVGIGLVIWLATWRAA
ncbi:hypothetical protein DFH09DRAFT_1266411 [Mycena vulgaris]|nr:hypothetical protein DFH09DRAFT_1266411 [Mycena vulgaris]